MSAKRGTEASDQAWRRRGKALARLLESVEFHKVDWRESRHVRKALAEVDSHPSPDLELYLGVEIAAGWLSHLIREFALDENTTPRQMELVIGAARGIIESGGFAWAAQQRIGSRDVDTTSKGFKDDLHAEKEARKRQTVPAGRKRRKKKEFLDEWVPVLAAEYCAKPGKSKSAPEAVAEAILDSINSKLSEAGLAGKKSVGVDAIANRLRNKPTIER
jgi:hypothetical protein